MRNDFREQTADERYGVPENFLEIEVRDPQLKGDKSKYIDYEIVLRVRKAVTLDQLAFIQIERVKCSPKIQRF